MRKSKTFECGMALLTDEECQLARARATSNAWAGASYYELNQETRNESIIHRRKHPSMIVLLVSLGRKKKKRSSRRTRYLKACTSQEPGNPLRVVLCFLIFYFWALCIAGSQ